MVKVVPSPTRFVIWTFPSDNKFLRFHLESIIEKTLSWLIPEQPQ